mmetsp:Transcript_23110/g.54634  ORF Transcript_23110/g.54634 Transcript_23110/m.54634 type:complete len:519 (+) Transcript_23110:250-1806(+)
MVPQREDVDGSRGSRDDQAADVSSIPSIRSILEQRRKLSNGARIDLIQSPKDHADYASSVPLFLVILEKQRILPDCALTSLIFEAIMTVVDTECLDLMHRCFYPGGSDNELLEDLDLDTVRIAFSKSEDVKVNFVFEQYLFELVALRMILSLHKLPDRLVETLIKNESFCHLSFNVSHGVESEIHEWLGRIDIGRDTEETVEASVRLFPRLLRLPVDHVTTKLHILQAAESRKSNSVSFVPLLAELGVEYGGTADRGGLLAYNKTKSSRSCSSEHLRSIDWNALEYMMGPLAVDDLGCLRFNSPDEFDYIKTLEELRNKKLFFKEDIARSDLLDCLLSPPGEHGFAAKERVRYIADLDPMSLGREKQRHRDWILPLHRSVMNFPNIIDAFRTVLESGINHFPSKLGFLFHMDGNDQTPFQYACLFYGKEIVAQHVKEIFADANYSVDQMLECLVALSVDESVHVEAVYLVLRGEYMRRGDPSTIVGRALCGSSADGNRKRRRRAGVPKQNSNRYTEMT